jgi:hypothetical protein
MRIYTHPMLYQVVNVQNLLQLNGIETRVRNQYAGGAAGDLAINETWVELWLCDERDQEKAALIIESLTQQAQESWSCGSCGERNSGSFEFCWQCQSPRKAE